MPLCRACLLYTSNIVSIQKLSQKRGEFKNWHTTRKQEKEAKELYEKGEIGHSEEEMLRVSMGEPYYRYELDVYKRQRFSDTY